jgi:hypothetical protein
LLERQQLAHTEYLVAQNLVNILQQRQVQRAVKSQKLQELLA